MGLGDEFGMGNRMTNAGEFDMPQNTGEFDPDSAAMRREIFGE
jgi:hypothetical protein